MDTNTIAYLVTILVTYILGIIAKKNPKISNKIIPIQNICVGIIIFLIEWAVTKDPNIALTISGLTAGGIYDVLKNSKEIIGGEK